MPNSKQIGGRNRMQLMNGDCLELMKGIPDGSVDMVLCDLPYGTTACAWDSVISFDRLWDEYKRALKPDGVLAFTSSQPFTTTLVASNMQYFRYELVWEKSKATGHALCNKRPMKAHESICIFSKGAHLYNPQKTPGKPYKQRLGTKESKEFSTGTSRNDNASGDRYPRSVLYFKTAESEGKSQHPTQKPVALMEYLIRTYTHEGMTVLDNCMGSGTTGVACVNTGRKFIGIEMDEGYFDIAQKRIAGAVAAKDLETAISLSLDASDKTA